MVVGYPPFYSENSKDTCKKIMNWRKHLKYPSNVKVSDEVKDLMNGLINDVDKRLGYHGSEEIKRHPWFKDVDWNNLKSMKPPFIPRVSSDYDVKYFETFQEKANQPFHHVDGKKKNVDKDICFLDFSFDKKSRKTKLLDFFEQIEEGLHSKRARDKSNGVRPSNLFNIHTNFQSNLSETSNQSSGNLKEKSNIVDIIKSNTLIRSTMIDRQNASTLTIEGPSLSERLIGSPNNNIKKTETNMMDLRDMEKETPKSKLLPMLETKTKFNLKNSTSLSKSKIEHLESSKRLPKNAAASPNSNSIKMVSDSTSQLKSMKNIRDSGVKASKIKQIEIDKFKLNPSNAALKASNLSPRESLLATAIGFKSAISNINNLKSVSPPKSSTKVLSSRTQK